MIIDQRQKQILELVKENGTISFSDLAEKLYASESTVRRDIKNMDSKGLLREIRGGASVIETNTSETSILIREQTNTKEKAKIATIAARYIKNGNSYFFDSSTTVSQLAYQLKNFEELTIITNGLDNALLLTYLTKANVYISGGKILKKTNSTHGSYSYQFIQQFNCDVAFISCRGVSPNGDITEANSETQLSKRAMLTNAKQRILLVDHSKFYKTFLLKTASLKNIDIVITDCKPDDSVIELCKACGVELIYE